ncbi:glycosyl transferase [Geranomyces variabilis]|uniref:Alpha-1,3-glucosyltransferase n=1 Tax=Geranomyces variabilis TaxID=109894 RepID=A0AAD5TJK4_9FUNG|nr:glycosyl transferase [Geranomyces variabilis]
MLIPSYRSTDFEVHRNWLAITHSLPRDRWYYEDTSEWTLDYPPFFAWFEFALAKCAAWWHPQMLDIDALGYASPRAVLFQRLSVVLMDSVLLFGAVRVTARVRETRSRLVQIALIVLSPGLLFVDHIHFQYNGFLYGIQLLSIAAMLENQHILGAILFAVVLNFKHIYLYQAPAYFIYLLRAYCFTDSTRLSSFSPSRLMALGASTAVVFTASFGPFARHLPQIAARLFPFKRGLCHAYWAPNFWAVYAFVDRVAVVVARRVGFHVDKTASLTRGLVGNAAFSVLPDITPLHTMLLTVLVQLSRGAGEGFLWREGVYVGVGVGVFLYADVVAPFLASGGGGGEGSLSWVVLYVMGMKQ